MKNLKLRMEQKQLRKKQLTEMSAILTAKAKRKDISKNILTKASKVLNSEGKLVS